MAITINKQLTGPWPAYNDMIYIVISDKTAQANFKYIADIYIDGTSTRTHRMSVPAHPTLGTGVFNPARVVENFINNNFDLSLSRITNCEDSLHTIQLKFGEEYGLSSSGTTVYTNLTNSSTVNFWSGVFDFENFVDYDYTKYQSGSPSSQFLTNSPNNKVVYRDEKEYLYAINRTSGDIYYFNVTTYDSTGTENGNFNIYNFYQSNSLVSSRMVRMAAGWNLNNIISSDITIVLGTLPIMKTDVASYEILCGDSIVSETIGRKRYVNDTSCERFTKYRLHFLNKLGGYDSFSFTKKSKVNSEIKRESYKKNLGNPALSAYFDKAQRAVTNYATNINDKVSVTSDWLTSGDLIWLEELVTSPDVYVEKGGAAIPIVITSSSFDRQNGEDKKLFNLTIEFEYSYKRFRQRY